MAGTKYDIAKQIATGNQRPVIVIDADHEFKVNNSKSVALMAQAMVEEKGETPETLDAIIELALGEKAHEYIESLELSMPAYTLILNAVMAAFSGTTIEEIEKEATGKK